MKKNLSGIVYRETIEKQGCSLNLDGLQPAGGYMVSLKGYEQRVPVLEFSTMHVESFIRANLGLLNDRNLYIGTWIDQELVYIDISVNQTELKEALRIAKVNGQLAIYSIESGRTIELYSIPEKV
jgi:hypothetical protein